MNLLYLNLNHSNNLKVYKKEKRSRAHYIDGSGGSADGIQP